MAHGRGGQRLSESDELASYMPTREEIEAGKAEVQSKWTKHQRELRATYKPQPVRIRRVSPIDPNVEGYLNDESEY